MYPEKFKEEFDLYRNNNNSQIAENAINNLPRMTKISSNFTSLEAFVSNFEFR